MDNKIPFLQYAFLMNSQGKILTCDKSGRDFLKTINLELFYAQLQSLKINDAVTNTTVLLGNTSYNLRMVPTSLNFGLDEFSEPEYGEDSNRIIVLQDQGIFSNLFRQLNQITPFLKAATAKTTSISNIKTMQDIFGNQQSAIFIADTKGTVIFANPAYEKSTGLLLSDIIGKRLTDLESSGMLSPLITPTILQTREAFTTLQNLGLNKHAIISGSPIYDTSGKTSLILTCVNTIDAIALADFPDKFYNPPNIKINLHQSLQNQPIDLIAESPKMKALIQEAVKAAQYDATVLLLGESGTGKEVIASIIHTCSKRNSEGFYKMNCSAVSPTLLDSELFGYEAGSFTGASSKGKAGIFETANNGTLLLDEIGDMPLELQAKFLRVLQNKVICRVGSITPINVNVRIIASTNKNLEQMVKEGVFRQDLFYRLNVISLELPALRERIEDIKPLLLHFCYYYNKKYYANKTFSNGLIEILEKYSWPGNIRELQNVVERLTILCLEDTLLPQHFYSKYKFEDFSSHHSEEASSFHSPVSDSGITVNEIMPLNDAVALTEKLLISTVLKNYKSTREAAKVLGVSQSTIMRKIREHSIEL